MFGLSVVLIVNIELTKLIRKLGSLESLLYRTSCKPLYRDVHEHFWSPLLFITIALRNLRSRKEFVTQ